MGLNGMKLISQFAAIALATTLVACASSPTTTSGEAAASTEGTPSNTEESSSKGLNATYNASLDTTRDAAVAALKLTGFNIKSAEGTTVTGSRPHKIGLLVGSGGEKITVTLSSVSKASTSVNVRTEKTFVGIAGQKNWDDEVIASMNESLGVK